MDREFGSNMSYSALENVITEARIKYGFDIYGYKDGETKNVNDALDMVLDFIKLNYTIPSSYKGE